MLDFSWTQTVGANSNSDDCFNEPRWTKEIVNFSETIA